MKSNLKIIFAGTPEISTTVLMELINAGYIPELILTQPDRPAGRGMKLSSSPVKQLALENGIEVFQPLSFKRDPSAIEKIRQINPDLIIVVAYGLILPAELLNIPKLGCINIHVSLLPKWRGAAPIQRSLLAGDLQTGVSIMQMDEGLDTGDVLLVSKCPISDQDTSASLHDKLANLGAKTLIQYLANPEKYPAQAQTTQEISYAHKLTKEEANINWHEDIIIIERKIRGYNPFPGAFSFLNGQLHKFWQSKISNLTTTAANGTIIGITKDSLQIACANGKVIEIVELQEAGSKRKFAMQYLQGKSNLIGKCFTSEVNYE
ncbi:MAG: hypothetical protein RLZZ293_392 [Pseudomonadota bacterium]|jgi:methionyl-tRNA formyltransferase